MAVQFDDETIRQVNCLGFFGFGSGWAAQTIERFMPLTATGACVVCPMTEKCQNLHRQRVKRLMPAACQIWDGMYERLGPLQLSRIRMEFKKETTLPVSPYQLICQGNTADGISIGNGAAPAERGNATLVFPFVSPS